VVSRNLSLLAHRCADGKIPTIPLRAFDILAYWPRFRVCIGCDPAPTYNEGGHMSDNKKPVAKINLHPVSASIWSNETQKGTFYSVTLERSYKDDDGKWQYTNSLGQGDLLLAAKVLDLVHSRIYELRAAERKAARRRGRLTSWGRALFTGRSALFLHQFHQQRSHTNESESRMAGH
jgi:hypothetical protein